MPLLSCCDVADATWYNVSSAMNSLATDAVAISELLPFEMVLPVVRSSTSTEIVAPLSAARAVAHEGVPILAVNLGSLGFLTEVPLSELYLTLEAVDQGQCPTEQRAVLDCQLMRNAECISHHFALNDVVVNKSAISRLVEFDLYIDGNFVFQYKADGVIIATPTGSTAYSLAAGGPVLMPSVEAFVVTPVCPHSLTHRPLVVTEKSQIELRVETGEEQAFLSIDGQVGLPVQQGDRVLCQRATHKVKLMRARRTFFDVLRNKLKWGER